jgi:hypothetical protein
MSTAFILPSGLRPSHNLYLPIYTLNFTEGSVLISRRGAVHPIGSQASGFSSLDGISFAAGE